MSDKSFCHVREQERLRQWLNETEEFDESFNDEDPEEVEEDFVEIMPCSNSDDEEEEIPCCNSEAAEEEEEELFQPSSLLPLENNQSNTSHFDRREFYIGKDKTTRWYLEPQTSRTSRTQRHNIIPIFHRPGPKGKAKHVTTPIQALDCMLDDQIIQKIVDYTNIYVSKIQNNFQRVRDAKQTNITEIRALFGILFIAGEIKSGRRNVFEMWDNSKGTGVELAYVTMSEHRFRFLMRCLRFDDVRTRLERKTADKLAAIREVFEMFILNCKEMYNPSDYLAIDEQLVGFRGNCPFRVYMPNKPAKYGIKVFALVSNSNFYTTNLEVYLGKQPDGPFQVSNATSDLVLRLVEPVAGSNRNITCDNWFSSIPLALTLRQEKSLTLVSTLKKNKREIPENFLPDKDREVKSSIFGFQEKCTMVSYVTKRNQAVICISTMHNDGTIDPSTGEEKKPSIITTYNETKYAVDILDKMCREYDVTRNTKRWPMILFFHIMNVAGVNALNIFRANTNNTIIQRREFLFTLAFDLVKPEIMSRINRDMIPKEIKLRGKLLLKLPDEEEVQEAPPTASRGRCFICGRARNKMTRRTCFKCNKWVCPDHLKSICNNCFE